jgi:hypothetical protein
MNQQQNQTRKPQDPKTNVQQDDQDGAIPGSDQDTDQQQQSDPQGNRQQGGQPRKDIEGERE